MCDAGYFVTALNTVHRDCDSPKESPRVERKAQLCIVTQGRLEGDDDQ